MKRAQFLIRSDTSFQVGGYIFETYYPGEGHTKDNIVVWFQHEKILYGGCLVKGSDAQDLGYLGDANIYTYEASLRNVQKKCQNPSHIIVTHSHGTKPNTLRHSIKLARKLRRKSG